MFSLLQLMRIYEAVAIALLSAPNPVQFPSNLCKSTSLANIFWWDFRSSQRWICLKITLPWVTSRCSLVGAKLSVEVCYSCDECKKAFRHSGTGSVILMKSKTYRHTYVVTRSNGNLQFTSLQNSLNLLATDFFFLILAHLYLKCE